MLKAVDACEYPKSSSTCQLDSVGSMSQAFTEKGRWEALEAPPDAQADVWGRLSVPPQAAAGTKLSNK
jgi:hypothetical protein